MAISPGFSPGISTQPVNKGGTGATTASGARSNLGLAASTTDNAICRFDGTSGSTQNSGCTIDDSGNLTVSGTGTSTFAGVIRSTSTYGWTVGELPNAPRIYYGNIANTFELYTAANALADFKLNNLTVSGTQNTLGVPSSANALTTNSTMTFELTSNTSLTIKVRGTDGTTRSVALTLA